MFRVSFLRSAALIACAAVAAPGLLAQNNSNSIKLFGPTNVRLSLTTAGNPPNQVIFNSSTVQLSCSASPIQASVSSTADNTGNVITDNYINLTVTAGDSTTGPVNLCQGGVLFDGYYSCFTPYLEQLGGEGLLTGMDPDNYTALGRLPPSTSAATCSPAPTRQSSTSSTLVAICRTPRFTSTRTALKPASPGLRTSPATPSHLQTPLRRS